MIVDSKKALFRHKFFLEHVAFLPLNQREESRQFRVLITFYPVSLELNKELPEGYSIREIMIENRENERKFFLIGENVSGLSDTIRVMRDGKQATLSDFLSKYAKLNDEYIADNLQYLNVDLLLANKNYDEQLKDSISVLSSL